MRATVSRRVLDTLIRTKVEAVHPCKGVAAMPVSWRPPERGACNWTMPGWIGDQAAVKECTEAMRSYLSYLQAQFDIADGP